MPKPDPNAPARRKAEALMRQTGELGRRTTDTAEQQKTKLEELAALHAKNLAEMAEAQAARMAELAANQTASMAAMVTAQSERMAELNEKTADVAGLAAEIVELLADGPVTPPPPPPPPPPPKPALTAAKLLEMPFSRDGMHHWLLGDKVRYGIPPETRNPMVANPVYTDGVLGSRGRLAVVRGFEMSLQKINAKHLYVVPPGSPMRRVDWHHRGGTGDGLPLTIPMPERSDRFPYPPDGDGDSELVLLVDSGDPMKAIAYVFAQFSYDCPRADNPQASARAVRRYVLSGPDVRARFDDGGEWGPGAIDWRHPAGFLQDEEVDLSGNTPFKHILNTTATRHSRQGAPASLHVISKGMIGRAWNTDRPLDDDDNLGNLPYGTIIAIRREDAGLREKLNLSPLGKRLFDNFLGRGAVVCDGQGQMTDGGARLQLRIDYKLAANAEKCRALQGELTKLVPHLWPVFDMPKHNEPLPRNSKGWVVIGGGEPIVPEFVNHAHDA
jgi:hypothetical protein